MRIEEFNLPRSHMIIHDVFDPKIIENFVEEAVSLEKFMIEGQVINEGKEIINEEVKLNKDLWMDQCYSDNNDSAIMSSLRNILWEDNHILAGAYCESINAQYETLLKTTMSETHLIRYMDNDFYNWHMDSTKLGNSLMTISYMFCSQPQKFTGGDFELKWKDEVKTIPFENNCMIIFPSSTTHRATTVKLDDKDPHNARYTVQIWAR